MMCETRDLGIKWLFWYTLVFEGDRSIDMICVWEATKTLGRMKVNVKRRKAQKRTGSTTSQDGTRSEGRSQKLQKMRAKSQNVKERVEVAQR